jgi:UDP-N-acetylmuramoyl-tripeptide--D-alanyl-D-alanine ligase
MQTERNKLILDCYNANPSSMKVAVDNFASMKAEQKMVILGGMRELGSDSVAEHKALYALLQKGGFERIMLVGEEFRFAASNQGVEWYESCADLLDKLKSEPIAGATILVKGSNSNRLWLLEEVL